MKAQGGAPAGAPKRTRGVFPIRQSRSDTWTNSAAFSRAVDPDDEREFPP
jgi:hypothetical protein